MILLVSLSLLVMSTLALFILVNLYYIKIDDFLRGEGRGRRRGRDKWKGESSPTEFNIRRRKGNA